MTAAAQQAYLAQGALYLLFVPCVLPCDDGTTVPLHEASPAMRHAALGRWLDMLQVRARGRSLSVLPRGCRKLACGGAAVA